MIERSFTLNNARGLHGRPASLFVQAVQKFPGTEVFVRKDEKEVSARSLLQVMSLGAGAGSTVSIRCTGPQETEAMAALAQLLESSLGE